MNYSSKQGVIHLRPAKERKVETPPRIQGMKPIGVPGKFLDKVSLTIDEYEAVRLSDYKGLDHKQASEIMDISRPTFTRLLKSAHHKIADAIVMVKDLIFEGGHYSFARILVRCLDCNTVSDIGVEHTNDHSCPECHSENIICLNNVFQPGHCRNRRGFGNRGRNR